MPAVLSGASGKATYRASTLVTNIAGDEFTITGSAGKTIRITKITLVASGSNWNSNLQIIKRSTADSGGTSSAVTAVPLDSNNAVASATVLSYTVAPTAGTSVGAIWNAGSYDSAAGDTKIYNDINFGQQGQEVVLRGTSQQLAVNSQSASGALAISIEWTEE